MTLLSNDTFGFSLFIVGIALHRECVLMYKALMKLMLA